MEFTKALIKGKLEKRYKRFFVDIKVNKKIVIAHCPNTGSMKGLLGVNNEVWISKNNNPKRKLKYTLEIIKVGKNLVGVNTHLANKVVFLTSTKIFFLFFSTKKSNLVLVLKKTSGLTSWQFFSSLIRLFNSP